MPQAQPNTGFGSDKIDVGQLLKNLLTLPTNPNDPMQNWHGTANMNQSATQPTINPVTGLHDDQASALQSVLDKQDKADAEEALSVKGPDALRQLLDIHYSSSPEQNTPTDNKQTPVQPATTNQAQNNYGYKPDNPVSSFFNMLGITPTPEAQVLLTQAQMNRQKIAGQEPLQQSEIDKAALETKQKIDQALTVPPTQAEKLSNAAAYAGYKTTALKDMLDNNNTAMTQQNEILKNMQGYSSWINKPFGTLPKEAQSAVKKLKQLQLERLGISAELNKHQSFLASGGVSTSPFQEGQIYTDANGNKATFKNGKFQ